MTNKIINYILKKIEKNKIKQVFKNLNYDNIGDIYTKQEGDEIFIYNIKTMTVEKITKEMIN